MKMDVAQHERAIIFIQGCVDGQALQDCAIWYLFTAVIFFP
jgi:hypothetical protein